MRRMLGSGDPLRTRCWQLAQEAHGALEGPDRDPRGAGLKLLGAPRSRDALVLALEVPAHGRLERLLVRSRPPAELSARLRGAVGPPLAGGPDLERRERPALPARAEEAGGRARGAPRELH